MAIARQGSADLGNNGGVGNLIADYNVNAASNLLVVAINGSDTGTGDNIFQVSYDGHNLTRAGAALTTNSGRNSYLYYIFGPVTGSLLPIHITNGNVGTSQYIIAVAADYSGMGILDAASVYASASASPVACPVNVSSTGAWVIMSEMNSAPRAGPLSSDSLTQVVAGVALGGPSLWDSNGPVSSGSFANNLTCSEGIGAVVVSFDAPSIAGPPLLGAIQI